MKVTNEKRIESCLTAISFLLIISLSVLAILFMITLPNAIKMKISLSLFIFILSVLLYKLRCFVFEDSGEVITIKEFHPLSYTKIISPSAEFPKNYVQKLNIKQMLIGGVLVISFRKENTKVSILKFRIMLLTSKQKKEIQNSFDDFL